MQLLDQFGLVEVIKYVHGQGLADGLIYILKMNLFEVSKGTL